MKKLLIIAALIAGCDPPEYIPYKCNSTNTYIRLNEWTGNAFTFVCPTGTSLRTQKMLNQPRGLEGERDPNKDYWEIYCECEK
ncbi:MAG: hypothetical protein KGO96_06890 [Elusimicrobia bacterium]|nr:hypothetical protein [Elusimicrobiota bacterium]